MAINHRVVVPADKAAESAKDARAPVRATVPSPPAALGRAQKVASSVSSLTDAAPPRNRIKSETTPESLIFDQGDLDKIRFDNTPQGSLITTVQNTKYTAGKLGGAAGQSTFK